MTAPSLTRRARRARPLAAASLVALTTACAGTPAAEANTAAVPAPAVADSGAFVTRLGADTLALERFVRTARGVEAEVVLRVPATTRTRYVLALDAAGELERLEAEQLPVRAGAATRRESIVRVGDSLRVETVADGQTRTRTMAAEASVLPFIDMIHWPYEIALMRLHSTSPDSVVQPLLTGARVTGFRLSRLGGDSVAITHPQRGTMRARVDARGRLLGLDASGTTRKLVVERRPWVALDEPVARWAALDAQGRSLGTLSGRGETRETVAGANIVVDYGTPAKRGRVIWGALVPWGQLWRTGANQATHFTTDRDLVFGSGADTLRVPAGRYTLFSIPQADGGTLIVSRATGITGTAYDPAQDLGRVRLTMRALPETVELFTIAARPAAGGGELSLEWDRSALVVPFRVR